jgi:hypothetical protein
MYSVLRSVTPLGRNAVANRCMLHGVLMLGLFFYPEDGSDMFLSASTTG